MVPLHYRNLTNIIVSGKIRHISIITLSRYLPELWRLMHDYPYQRLDLDDSLNLHHDKYGRQALRFLFEYLDDVNKLHGESTALTDRLESSWKNTRRGSDQTIKLFDGFGRILGVLGCNTKIVSAMTGFLIHRCAEIVHGSPTNWISYINALEDMGADKSNMATILGFILKERTISHVELQRLAYNDDLYPDTIHLLARLMHSRGERQRRSLEHVACCPRKRNLGLSEHNLSHRRGFLGNGIHHGGILIDEPEFRHERYCQCRDDDDNGFRRGRRAQCPDCGRAITNPRSALFHRNHNSRHQPRLFGGRHICGGPQWLSVGSATGSDLEDYYSDDDDQVWENRQTHSIHPGFVQEEFVLR